MAQESNEEILRIASSLWVEKYHIQPSNDDICEMLDAVGDKQEFLKLPAENKARLLCGMLWVRRVDEMYRDLIDAGTDDPEPMRATLEKFVALAKKNHRHLGTVASLWAERLGIEQGWPAQLHMSNFLDAAEDVAQISWRIAGEPKSRDERHTGARRTKAETDGILTILKEAGIDVPKNKESKKAELAAAIVGYTSGEKMSGSSFVKRLFRKPAASRRRATPRRQLRKKDS